MGSTGTAVNPDAASYIGKNLNCLAAVDTLDVSQLLNTIPAGARALKLSSTQQNTPVTFTIAKTDQTRIFSGSEDLEIDVNVALTDQLKICNSGSAASSFLQVDASASASYGGVSVSGNTSFSSNKKYSESSMYAFYSWEESCYKVQVNRQPQHLLHPDLVDNVSELPAWDQNASDVVQQYEDFFSSNGTHVITGAKLGWRYLLTVQCDKSDADVNTDFTACVKAEYSGVGSMSASAGVKSKTSYSSYMSKSQSTCYVRGGDLTANSDAKSTADRQNGGEPGPEFSKWAASTSNGTGEQILSVSTMGLPNVLRLNKTTKTAAASLDSALKYFTAKVNTHVFNGRLFGRSDWLSFTLTNPAPTTKIVVPNPLPSIWTQRNASFRFGRFDASGVQMRATQDPTWQHVDNVSVPIQLQLAHATDPISFDLDHGAAGGSSDDDHYSQIDFYGDDGTTVIFSRNNWTHDNNNKQSFNALRIQQPS
ncbi:uncharacterized protein AB675_8448 [Cyphellophora attinorum]|uniref:MACPF domain-containing protein n=1 Tax=Cyphellophora attinorum TaxID=1664694 RepID=A0A0N0NQY6_9EURO|nr:uncharacterized protein AB675_8448 [Phialophora attinorum]KPI44471.1 hypothetical protein AB675_8448 [Phialophora attinorum]